MFQLRSTCCRWDLFLRDDDRDAIPSVPMSHLHRSRWVRAVFSVRAWAVEKCFVFSQRLVFMYHAYSSGSDRKKGSCNHHLLYINIHRYISWKTAVPCWWFPLSFTYNAGAYITYYSVHVTQLIRTVNIQYVCNGPTGMGIIYNCACVGTKGQWKSVHPKSKAGASLDRVSQRLWAGCHSRHSQRHYLQVKALGC